MATKRIYQLTASTSIAANDFLVIDQYQSLGVYSTKSVLASTAQVSFGTINVLDSTIPANGLYLPAANSLGIATSGTNRITIDSNGTVFLSPGVSGLGLTHKVQVAGTYLSYGDGYGIRFINTTGDGGGSIYSNNGVDSGITIDGLTGPLKFIAGSSERLRIDSSGNIGIGTSSPSGNFDIGTKYSTTSESFKGGFLFNSLNTTVNPNRRLLFSETAAGTFLIKTINSDLSYASDVNLDIMSGSRVTLGTNNVERLRIDSSGNVGIGATSNLSKLTVGQGNASAGIVTVNTQDTNTNGIVIDSWTGYATSYGPRMAFSNSNQGVWYIGGSDSSNNFDICTSWGTPKLRIDSGGRVLIGSSSDLKGDANAVIQAVAPGGTQCVFARTDGSTSSGANVGYVNFFSYAGNSWQIHASIGVDSDGVSGNNNKPGRIVFSTTASGGSLPTERMRIDSSGNVGIGCTPSSWGSTYIALEMPLGAALWTNRTGSPYTYVTSNMYYDGTNERYKVNGYATRYTGSGTSGEHIFYSAASGTAGNIATMIERLRIDSRGNVGISTTDPTGGWSSNVPAQAKMLGISGDGSDNGNSYGGITIFNNRTTPATTDNLGAIFFNSLNDPIPLKSYILGNNAGSGGTNGFGGNLIFFTKQDNSTNILERLRIDSSGTAIFSGNAEITTAGTGLKLSSSPANSNANTLDCYEENTWTPVITGSVSNPTVTYTDRNGFYTRIGNIVHCRLEINCNITVAGSGYCIISLPITTNSSGVYSQHFMVGFTSSSSSQQIKMIGCGNNTTSATLYLDVNGGLSSAATTGNITFAMNFSYFA